MKILEFNWPLSEEQWKILLEGIDKMAVDKNGTTIQAGDKIQDKYGNTGTILGITNNGSLLAFADDVTGETRRALCRESTKVVLP